MPNNHIKNPVEEFAPSKANYFVCSYCKKPKQVNLYNPDGYIYACPANKDKNGKLKMIAPGLEGAVNSFKGCEKFESSGLPAHPTVLRTLIEENPKCISIPSDPKAIETDWNFIHKAEKFLYESYGHNDIVYVSPEEVHLVK